MGTHTGDSVTIAPALTLTDKEYQVMRNASIACLRKIGVETGGSNVQFAINPKNGRMVIIEMNPWIHLNYYHPSIFRINCKLNIRATSFNTNFS